MDDKQTDVSGRIKVDLTPSRSLSFVFQVIWRQTKNIMKVIELLAVHFRLRLVYWLFIWLVINGLCCGEAGEVWMGDVWGARGVGGGDGVSWLCGFGGAPNGPFFNRLNKIKHIYLYVHFKIVLKQLHCSFWFSCKVMRQIDLLYVFHDGIVSW